MMIDQKKPAEPVAVYYDGSCPLCSKEMSLYKRSTGSNEITWCDVSSDKLPPGLSREQAMSRFHVRTGSGDIVSGAPAFIVLWLSLPRWRWLGKIASVPPLPWVLEKAYRLFLPIRPVLQWFARKL
jgi:predicted DCC family thiol-disulfide oxidoreductase YuxK